jgi:hypothetical protein
MAVDVPVQHGRAAAVQAADEKEGPVPELDILRR